MIFVTVGTQGPFDRLVRTVDEWAGLRGKRDVFAQTGPTGYRPLHIRAKHFISPVEFRQNVEAAEIVISHAGMGSIITALEFGKRIIVMPRRPELNEQRNDHQIGTTKRFAQDGRVIAAYCERELRQRLEEFDSCPELERVGGQASSHLIATLRAFIEQDQRFPVSGAAFSQPTLDAEATG